VGAEIIWLFLLPPFIVTGYIPGEII
jgi:hypothetical protein